MNYAKFIELFPEFSDFSESRVSYFLDESERQISENRFGESTEFARALFVAHFLTTLNNGQKSGESSLLKIASGEGAISSKSVGGASVSYDNASSSFTNAGIWNASAYGKQLYELMLRFRKLPFVVNSRASIP